MTSPPDCGSTFSLDGAKAFRKIAWLLTWEMIPVREQPGLPFGFSPETTSISPTTFTRDQAFTAGVEYLVESVSRKRGSHHGKNCGSHGDGSRAAAFVRPPSEDPAQLDAE